jgi:hypothetical protein
MVCKFELEYPFTTDIFEGRKISVDVHFSACGRYLLIGNVEVVKSNRHASQEKPSEETYALSAQVAVLQLRFEEQTLKNPIPVAEQHFDLPAAI